MQADKEHKEELGKMLERYARKSLSQTASHLGLSTQMVGQIQASAFRKIFKAFLSDKRQTTAQPEQSVTASHYKRVTQNGVFLMPQPETKQRKHNSRRVRFMDWTALGLNKVMMKPAGYPGQKEKLC